MAAPPPAALLLAFALAGTASSAQRADLPAAFSLSQNGTRLTRGHTAADQGGLYRLDTVRTLALTFATDDWFAGVDGGTLPATAVFAGDTLREVDVRVKGSSTDRTNLTLKKSFALDLDAAVDGQDLSGYDALNLHCAIYDESHVREALFYWIGGHYLPVPLSNFVHLTVNGANWGAYTNTQQQDRDFVREWFADDSGPRWRGTATLPFPVLNPDTAACGPRFPGGREPALSALAYLGDRPADYAPHYTPKGDHDPGDAQDLADFIAALNTLPDEQLVDSLPAYLDVDAALWFLAHEIALTDEDGYVYKTHSDFYLYREPATGRVTPLEYDGNGALQGRHNDWGPLHRADNPCLPLLHRLLGVPEWRQRYLAHVRTIVDDYLDPAVSLPVVDTLAALIDPFEADDPIGDSIYTYAQFRRGLDDLARALTERHAFLSAHPLLTPRGPALAGLAHAVAGEPWRRPTPLDTPTVTVRAPGAPAAVRLYHATGLTGRFARSEMRDDGIAPDALGGDGVYSAHLPPRPAGVRVRYYVEGIAADAAATASYLPARAEADVLTYVVLPEHAPSSDPLAINEVVASNRAGAADEAGEREDWLEVHNRGDAPVELAGYTLSDEEADLGRWAFPADAGAIEPGGFAVVWCDGDEGQGALHANFRLDRDGETVFLADARGRVVDRVTFGPLPRDSAFARAPDGVGDFAVAVPTFGRTNVPAGDTTTPTRPGLRADEPRMELWPNPARANVVVDLRGATAALTVFDARGRAVYRGVNSGRHEFAVADWPAGVYTAVATGGLPAARPAARRFVVGGW